MAVELIIPEVGESVTEAQIGRWLKKEGDHVDKDEPIVELETDKVTVELPAPAAGTLSSIAVKKGETAKVGDVIGTIEEGQGEAKKEDKKPTADKKQAGPQDEKQGKKEETAKQDDKPPAKRAEPTSTPADDQKPSVSNEERKSSQASDQSAEKPAQTPEQLQQHHDRLEVSARVMPAARRALSEHQLSPRDVKPTGPGGRMIKEDVLRAAQQRDEKGPPLHRATSPQPIDEAPQSSHDREEEVVPMSPMRRRIAQRLVAAQKDAALLTTFNEIDMTAVMALRKEHQDSFEKRYKIRLGFMSFFVKASIEALGQYPGINAQVRDESIVYRNYYDISIAISSPRGLVVPVIRNAERLSFSEIEGAIADFAVKARDNKLKLEDIQGGTFTITNGGVFGSLLSTPIVNPPQSCVLGMHTIQKRPVAINDQVVIRPLMYVALTYDHRVVDGREAVSFLRRIKETLEEPVRMLIEV